MRPIQIADLRYNSITRSRIERAVSGLVEGLRTAGVQRPITMYELVPNTRIVLAKNPATALTYEGPEGPKLMFRSPHEQFLIELERIAKGVLYDLYLHLPFGRPELETLRVFAPDAELDLISSYHASIIGVYPRNRADPSTVIWCAIGTNPDVVDIGRRVEAASAEKQTKATLFAGKVTAYDQQAVPKAAQPDPERTRGVISIPTLITQIKEAARSRFGLLMQGDAPIILEDGKERSIAVGQSDILYSRDQHTIHLRIEETGFSRNISIASCREGQISLSNNFFAHFNAIPISGETRHVCVVSVFTKNGGYFGAFIFAAE